jgi:hypothetical protein
MSLKVFMEPNLRIVVFWIMISRANVSEEHTASICRVQEAQVGRGAGLVGEVRRGCSRSPGRVAVL